MPIWLRSRIGMVLALGYLLFLVVIVIGVTTGPPDAMSGLAILIWTMPWSFLLLDALIDNHINTGLGPLTFYLVIGLSAMINASILYGVGLAFTLILKAIK